MQRVYIMGMVSDFKEFAVKGNMMDLAIGIIIGGAFGKIIDSLVNDLIMPLIAALFGGKIDFANRLMILGDNPNGLNTLADLKTAGIPVFAYGNFFTILLNFFLLAVVVFFLMRVIQRIRQESPQPPAAPSFTDALLIEIRDALKERNHSDNLP